MKNPFKTFTYKDWTIYLLSIVIILSSSFFASEIDYFKMGATIIGATSLIFIAKGHFFGQIIMILFATCYSILSYINGYYGEIIISAGLTLPLAIRDARPSISAVLPTPGSPIRQGLFFCLRQSMRTRRESSFSLPISGSVNLRRAEDVRSFP